MVVVKKTDLLVNSIRLEVESDILAGFVHDRSE